MITIEVKRSRSSVTQGSATVYINGKEILTFGDNICLKQKDGTFSNGFNTVENAKHYGEVIGGYGSIKPDSDFIIGALYHRYDNLYHYSNLAKEAIKEDD